MTALVQFFYDGGAPLLGIVADDTGVEYVWPSARDAFFEGEAHLAAMLEVSGDTPTTAADWLLVASRNLGRVEASPTFEAATLDDGVREARAAFEATREHLAQGTGATAVAGAFDEAYESYPYLGDETPEGDDADPSATLTLVLEALGPIDPEGPNGWILRAMDGEPRDGDETMGVRL